MTIRGVVVAAPFEIRTDGIALLSSVLDPTDLRRWALYWDRIDWPTNNIVHLGGSTPDIDVLISEGVLRRSNVQVMMGGPLHVLFVTAQFAAFQTLSEHEPGQWSIAQGGGELWVPRDFSAEGVRVDLDLMNVLPTPESDVPMDHILRFKEDRSAELLQLRTALDELYMTIVGSPDPDRALIAAKDRIQIVVDDLDRVLGESRIRRFFSSTRVSLDVTESIKGAALGAVAAGGLGVPLALGGALGAAHAGLKVTVERGGQFAGVSEAARAYAYLGFARKDLGAK